MSTSYNLNFMHPQYGTTLNVDIEGSFTVEEVLEQLRLSGFMGQDNRRYDLELMGEALARQTLFMDIPTLYDGAVLRLVAPPSPNTTPSAPTSILIHAKHPTEPYLMAVELLPTALLSELLQQAHQRGFVASLSFYVTKGVQVLDLNQTLAQNGLNSGDYVQLHPSEAPEAAAPTVTLTDLQAQLRALQQTLQTHAPLAVAPLPKTELDSVFEPLEVLVQDLRGDAAPLVPIKSAPARAWWVLVGLLLLVLTGLGFAYHMGWLGN